MAILAIYIVLGVPYESFIYAITILSGLPPAVFGTLPVALGCGEGADAHQPLGLAVVGGLVVSPFPTLYITPVIYL
ncbi:MAG: efflux RND transporter permease subunit [Bryobacteraceae bacterium]